MAALQLLPYALFLTVLLAMSATGHAAALRADLTHVDSGRGFTKRELLRRMATRSQARVDSRWSPPPGRGANAHAAVTAPLTRGTVGKQEFNSDYLIHFAIGTPQPQPVALALDTGSDIVWTQCDCNVCFDQPFPALNTSASDTLRGVSCFDPLCARGRLKLSGCVAGDNFCLYVYAYGDKSITTGVMFEDTFTFKAPNGKVAAVPKVRFGCGMYNAGNYGPNESGIAGFARGPLSLPSQLKLPRFSHCFTTMVDSTTSPMFLGTPDNLGAQATGPIRIQSTPFVRSPAGPFGTLYYISLKGITVGKTWLPFDASAFAIKDGVSGGTIIDSGTSITNFPRPVFRSLRKAFMSQVPLPVANVSTDPDMMLCFLTSPKDEAPAMPKLILHLDGADWELPRENYVVDIEDDDGTGGGPCVVINSADEGSPTIIGNFQQQNTHIVYDLENNKLVFVPARCDKL